MGVTKPQAHLPVLPNIISGTDRISHNVPRFSHPAATDLLLDLPLQRQLTCLSLIHTKLKAKGMFSISFKEWFDAQFFYIRTLECMFCFSSTMGQPSNQVRQQASSSSVSSMQSKYQASCSSQSAQRKPTPYSGSQMGQQSSYRFPDPTHLQYFQQSRPVPPPLPLSRPSAHTVQSRSNSWNFTNSFGSQTSTSEGKRNTSQPKTTQLPQSQVGICMGNVI